MTENDEDGISDEEAINAIQHLKALRESPGWTILSNIIQAQIQIKTQKCMLSPGSSPEMDFQKGEAAAFGFVLELLNTEIESRRYDRDANGTEHTDAESGRADAGDDAAESGE